MLLHSTSYISADFTLYPSYVVFAVIVFGDFYVGAFLRFCVIIIVEIVDETVVMVPNCTAELNTLMNELEMSELEVSFNEFQNCIKKALCRLWRQFIFNSSYVLAFNDKPHFG